MKTYKITLKVGAVFCCFFFYGAGSVAAQTYDVELPPETVLCISQQALSDYLSFREAGKLNSLEYFEASSCSVLKDSRKATIESSFVGKPTKLVSSGRNFWGRTQWVLMTPELQQRSESATVASNEPRLVRKRLRSKR